MGRAGRRDGHSHIPALAAAADPGGARHRTPAGVLAVDAVTVGDARAAGFGSLAELRRQLERLGGPG